MTLADRNQLEILEATYRDHRTLSRDLELLGWNVLDYMSGNPQELDAKTRREWAQKARNVWLQDPQAGAAVDLMNDFVFGRGVPKPRAKDEDVQEVIDEAWDDPDNRLILTSYEAQCALGTDLSLQSNLFLLMFEAEDGKVKLGILNHDEVENVVRDPDFRQRVLYYTARHRRQEWDFEHDRPKVDMANLDQLKVTYYEHWCNVEQAEEEDADVPKAPKSRVGDGRVYHIAINRTSEMAFGVPTMRRLLRWYSAYNDFMAARVDMAQAAAAFIMRRKIKGTSNQVARMAAKAISRNSELAGFTGTGDSPPQMPPRGGSILTENENVSHENLSLNSNAGAAAQDAQMIRANISAGTRFPQSYYGDASNSNLATATSLELPVLKAVEARQEVFEGVFRWFLDRVIENAVDSGRISKMKANDKKEGEGGGDDTGPYGPPALEDPTADLEQAYEEQGDDEDMVERDLGYDLSMPSPLKRTATDLSTIISTTAKTFDPNGTNMELSRMLLTILLGEALEIDDPAGAVEKIFPEGYEDPMMAQAMGGAGGFAQDPSFPQAPPPPPTPPGAPGAPEAQNPYGAPGMSSNYQKNQGQIQQAVFVPSGRFGQPLVAPREPNDGDVIRALIEARLSETQQVGVRNHITEDEQAFEEEILPVVTDVLATELHRTFPADAD
jgi:hypothetical protein